MSDFKIFNRAKTRRPPLKGTAEERQCLFQAFLEGNPPPKNFLFPHTAAAKLCTLNVFSAGTMNYKYITKTFSYWTINTGNYHSCVVQFEEINLKFEKVQ